MFKASNSVSKKRYVIESREVLINELRRDLEIGLSQLEFEDETEACAEIRRDLDLLDNHPECVKLFSDSHGVEIILGEDTVSKYMHDYYEFAFEIA